MTEPRVIRSISAANFALISDEFAKHPHPKDAMIFEIHALRAERDALRERAAAAEAESEALLSVLERVKPNIHIDAALAVQP